MARSRGRITKGGIVALWVLGGVGRQIKLDVKHGVLDARSVFRKWVKTKWLHTPKLVRVPLFAIWITGRTAVLAGYHSGKTVRHGFHIGLEEGGHRYRERTELRDMQRDYPRDHPHLSDRLEQIRADRIARRDAHAVDAVHRWNIARAARHAKRNNIATQREAQRDMNAAWGKDRKKWHAAHARLLAAQVAQQLAAAIPVPANTNTPKVVAPPPTPGTSPRTGTSDPLVGTVAPTRGTPTPSFPGEPIGTGHWLMTHAGHRAANRYNLTRTHAEKLAAWQRWRNTQPGGQAGDVVVTPMLDRLDYFRGPDGELRFGATLDDPNGVKSCSQCDGTTAYSEGTCPSCQARGDIRFKDHRRRKAASNGHVVPPPVIPAPANKNSDNGGKPVSQTVNAEAGTSIPRLHAAYQSTTEGLVNSGEQATRRAELANARATAHEALSASYMDISGQLSAHGHDPIDVNAAADVADQLRVLAERQTAIAALESDLAGSFMDSSARVAAALEESQTRNAQALEAAGSTASNAPLSQYRE